LCTLHRVVTFHRVIIVRQKHPLTTAGTEQPVPCNQFPTPGSGGNPRRAHGDKAPSDGSRARTADHSLVLRVTELTPPAPGVRGVTLRRGPGAAGHREPLAADVQSAVGGEEEPQGRRHQRVLSAQVRGFGDLGELGEGWGGWRVWEGWEGLGGLGGCAEGSGGGRGVHA
jgi:hypothetical protein